MLSNATFNMDQPYRPSSNRLFGQLRPRRREARSSVRDVEKKHRKHDHKHHHTDHESNKNKKKHKHKHKKKHKLERHAGGESGAETPEYRKLIRRAAMMRRKRANLYEDAWDPVDSGYEEPVIYSASGKLTSGSGKRRRSPEEKDEVKRDVISASVALQPWLNPKSDDPMTSGYLNQLTNRLVRESLTPPVYEERKSANGRSLADDEVMLLSKREAWRNENEQQLEEVAFGKDMRGKWRDEERFKKLTDIDRKKKFDDDGIGRQKREGDEKRNSNSSNSLGSAQLSQVAKNEKVGNSTPTVNDANLVKRSTNSDNVINRNSTKAVSLQTENSEAKFLDSKLSSLVSGAKNEQGLISGVHERGESQNEVDRVPRTEYKQRHSTLSRELQSRGPDQSTQNPDQKESITRKIAIIDKNSATSKEPIEKRNGKRSSPFVIPEAEGSAILPHLEVSEQRQQQKQAAKTETDDQRDIANQVLGLDNPLILGLNTY
ncbi:serine/threonine-protein kinase PRP4 homolog [Neodiprion fabricii]|uniref:serine/threonine-protein kinase PRP4 homolog n=1 Tax=Neodiprion fabricii TaxID=2872261 RepID=UPI001ED929C3|nr:serine/threonine-protein kinase PRP4 homolog [Neodiprion fabricii]